jgi:hypothetical protein
MKREIKMRIQQMYKPRFMSEVQGADIVNLYHLARTALSGQDDSRYQRMLWAAKEFHKEHPEISETAAYKDLSAMLS